MTGILKEVLEFLKVTNYGFLGQEDNKNQNIFIDKRKGCFFHLPSHLKLRKNKNRFSINHSPQRITFQLCEIPPKFQFHMC